MLSQLAIPSLHPKPKKDDARPVGSPSRHRQLSADGRKLDRMCDEVCFRWNEFIGGCAQSSPRHACDLHARFSPHSRRVGLGLAAVSDPWDSRRRRFPADPCAPGMQCGQGAAVFRGQASRWVSANDHRNQVISNPRRETGSKGLMSIGNSGLPLGVI